MSSGRRPTGADSVIHITPGQKTRARKRSVGLTEEERQILLAELAEIAAELDELQARTLGITARVHRAGSATPAHETGAA